MEARGSKGDGTFCFTWSINTESGRPPRYMAGPSFRITGSIVAEPTVKEFININASVNKINNELQNN